MDSYELCTYEIFKENGLQDNIFVYETYICSHHFFTIFIHTSGFTSHLQKLERTTEVAAISFHFSNI